MYRLVLSSLAAAAALVASAAPAAAVPTQVGFSGRLATADGMPVDGAISLGFRIYEGPTLVWEETHASVTARTGLVAVSLGSIDPLDATIFTGEALQLEILVGAEALSPRLAIASVPYATRTGIADDAMRLGGMPATEFAPATHNHDGSYLPLGTTLSCGANQKVVGVSTTGDVVCSPDMGAVYGAAPGGGLVLNGTEFGILDNAITSQRLADNAVTSAKIVDSSVTAADIATDAVGASEIATDSVGASEIAPSSITAMEIAQGAVGSLQITADAVGSSEIATDAVGSAEIAAGAVGSSELANGVVNGQKIDASEVQARVTGTCPNGSAVTGISSSGIVTCGPRVVSGRITSPAQCNGFSMVTFSPAFSGTPTIVVTPDGINGAAGFPNSYCVVDNVSVSSFQVCCHGTNPDFVGWIAID